MADFSEILQRSRALRARQSNLSSSFPSPLPRLERALPQIDQESRRLISSHSPPPTHDPSALRLLSEFGFRTDTLERNLQSVALLDAFKPYDAVADTDLDAYLGAMHENAIVGAIETALAHAKDVSAKRVERTVANEWDLAKRELVMLNTSVQRVRGNTKKTLTVPGGGFASPFRSQRTTAAKLTWGSGDEHKKFGARAGPKEGGSSIFEGVVRKAVHGRARPNGRVSVATEMDDVLISRYAPGGDINGAVKSVQQMHSVFNVVRYLVGEANVAVAPTEGVFGGMWGKEEKRKAIMGGHLFLCLQFREDKMRREIGLRPVEAKRGGKPGMRADIRAYLNLVFDRGVPEQLSKGIMVDGMPLWAMVYYAMRAGTLETAFEVVQEAVSTGGADSSLLLVEKCMGAVLASGDMRSLPQDLLEELVQDYDLTAKRGEDPYKRVVFVVLARLDPAAGDKMTLPDGDYSLLFYSVEDYLWLRLSVVRMDGDVQVPQTLARYQLSLKAIQEEIRCFGPGHFDPQGETPAFYAFVLLLTGQYAAAVTYLDQKARQITEAAHLAYTLYYYGVFREKDTRGGEDEECFMFDYADLLWRYVSRFCNADPATACVYLFTLRNPEIRNVLLRRLLLDTKEFGLLVGDRNKSIGGQNASRTGVLEELWPLGGRSPMGGNNWLSIVEAAASEAEESGDRNSAMALYDVAGARGRVVLLLVDKLCAELVSKDSIAREAAFNEAVDYRNKLGVNPGQALGIHREDLLLQQLMPSFEILLGLGTFFDLLWAKDYGKAWMMMESLKLLPTTDGQLVARIGELRVGGGVYTDSLCDRIPEVVMGAVECLGGLFEILRRDGRVVSGGGVLTAASVKEVARTLLNFSGMLNNVSADISARLVQLDVLMS